MGPTALLLLLAAAAGTSAESGMTLQQRFDAATSAWQAGKCSDAVTAFEGIERDRAARSGSLVEAAIAVRKGMCLAKLDRPSEAEASIRAGLPRLGQAGEDFRDEVHDATVMLGRIALQRWDYATAADRFKEALAGPVRPDRAQMLVNLANAEIFDTGPDALAALDEAEAIIREKAPADRDSLVTIQTVRGRALLNQGRNKDGYDALKQALKLSGGLTLKTTLAEASMRGDLAQAALLNGDEAQAKLYMAYTGAGRAAAGEFNAPAGFNLPDCGSAGSLKPDDPAIVELTLSDSGAVASAQTIYTRGGAEAAAAFARAASEWRWEPDKLAKIPAFFKAAVRIEMRCSVALADADPFRPLIDESADWLDEQLARMGINGDETPSSDRLEAIAAARATTGDQAGQAAALIALLLRSGEIANSLRISDTLLRMPTSVTIPPEALSLAKIARAYMLDRRERMRTNAALQLLLDDPEIKAQPIAVNTVRLLAATRSRSNSEKRDFALIAAVAEDGRLAPTHPLRQRALIEMANQAAAAKDFTTAQAYFERTGLTESQCALLGMKPAMRSTGASSSDYPMEALRMGFEGWVRVEFDIDASGRTSNIRPLIAYPPLVFVPAATGMARDVRYQPSYRPSGGTACQGNSESFRFILP